MSINPEEEQLELPHTHQHKKGLYPRDELRTLEHFTNRILNNFPDAGGAELDALYGHVEIWAMFPGVIERLLTRRSVP